MTKNIFFRGEIDFCNYSCSYCPFAKKTLSKEKIQKESENLEKLYLYVKNMQEDSNVMITPYGEALIHPLYQEFMARISTLENVRKIGIQSNLSIDTDELISTLSKNHADYSKIMLWATFHSEYADIENFCNKANSLSELISISCGIVANRKNYEEIRKLRENLNANIYLWINAMDKIKNRFSEEEITSLSKIDPMFAYEFYAKRIDYTQVRGDNFSTCQSYDKIYVDIQKYSSSCFFKKKRAIDSLCKNHKICDCYLGYSNFGNNILDRFFGENIIFRIAQKRKFKAIFIDIDGVMTGKYGKLINNLTKILEDLSKKTGLYIASSRNIESAKKLLGKNFQYFKGGVFSDGCYTVDFERSTEKITALDDSVNINCFEEKLYESIAKSNEKEHSSNICKTNFNENDRIKENTQEINDDIAQSYKLRKDIFREKLLRISLPSKIAKNIDFPNIKKRVYNNSTFFQNQKSSKLSGIKYICKINNIIDEEILIISDNIQDEELFENIMHSVSPLYQKKLHKKSRYILDLCHLTFIIK